MKTLKKRLFLRLKIITETVLFLISVLIVSKDIQAFKISKNSVVRLNKKIQVKITEMDLNNEGEFSGASSSTVVISTATKQAVKGNPMLLGALKIAGDLELQASELALQSDLTLQSGIFNIQTNQLIIQGDLFGENEKTYVTASTGAIQKTLFNLSEGETVNAIGLEFKPLSDIPNLLIIRTHQSVIRTTARNSSSSSFRCYHFSVPQDLKSVFMQTLPHETKHVFDQKLFVEDLNGWKRINSPDERLQDVLRVSVFSSGDLEFPEFVTPNEATNNMFEITGLEEYPNSRLLIISKEGKILHDFFPYKNDFDAKDLHHGTYYYTFSLEYYSSPIKKSSFEVIR